MLVFALSKKLPRVKYLYVESATNEPNILVQFTVSVTIVLLYTCAWLLIGEGELALYSTVENKAPKWSVAAIGAAPSAGRPRPRPVPARNRYPCPILPNHRCGSGKADARLHKVF